jgi:hypothetical protein
MRVQVLIRIQYKVKLQACCNVEMLHFPARDILPKQTTHDP